MNSRQRFGLIALLVLIGAAIVLFALGGRPVLSRESTQATTTAAADPAETNDCYLNVTYWLPRMVNSGGSEVTNMAFDLGNQSRDYQIVLQVWNEVMANAPRQGISKTMRDADTDIRRLCRV